MRHLFFLSIIIFITSCSAIVGIKKTTYLDDVQIKQFCNISSFYICTSIDSSYDQTIKQIKNKRLINALQQPLQFRYYEKSKLKILLVNCDLQGFPKLNWNTYRTLDSFPIQNFYYYPDSINISFEKSILRDKVTFPNEGTAIFIYCNVFMQKQTDILLNFTKKLEHFKLPTYLVNNDNYFYYLDKKK